MEDYYEGDKKHKKVSVRINIGRMRREWLSILNDDMVKDHEYFIIKNVEQVPKKELPTYKREVGVMRMKIRERENWREVEENEENDKEEDTWNGPPVSFPNDD